MPITSAFTPPGHFAFSSRPSHGESIYRTLQDNFGDVFSVSDSSLQQARLYAQAMALASAQYQVDRAANNKNPRTATELLGELEQDYQVVPAYNATLNQRRAYLAALQVITRGNRREAIVSSLTMLLGSAFIDYRITAPANLVSGPASPGTVGVFAARGSKKKVFSLNAPVSVTGSPVIVQFTALGDTEPPLAGETYCVDPDPRHATEQITISAVTPTTITATFANAHESGTLAARPHPLWYSNQRYDLIFVTLAAATDPETRRKINELMARAARAVSQWGIAHNQGYFTCDDPVLGLADCTPVS